MLIDRSQSTIAGVAKAISSIYIHYFTCVWYYPRPVDHACREVKVGRQLPSWHGSGHDTIDMADPTRRWIMRTASPSIKRGLRCCGKIAVETRTYRPTCASIKNKMKPTLKNHQTLFYEWDIWDHGAGRDPGRLMGTQRSCRRHGPRFISQPFAAAVLVHILI